VARVARTVVAALKWGVLAFIRIYQLCVSPHIGSRCRYSPTCSRYAYQAVSKYGPFRGGFMAMRRLLRCHPWSPGGYDPVT